MKKVEQKFLKFISQKQLIKENDKILVTLSGGPDSVLLLHLLNKFKKKFTLTLAAVHINHSLRGKDSDNDEKFAVKLCNGLGIKLYIKKIDVKSYASKKKISIEEAARILRYDIFENLLIEINFDKIATGHILDDNAETVLLNLFKGAGFTGLSGIPIRRDKIIRPLLTISKEEILDYLKENKLKFRLDKSNKDNIYERNIIRNNILPIIKKEINPNISGALFRTSEIVRDIDRMISMLIIEKTDSLKIDENHKLTVPIKLFDEFKNINLKEFIRRILINKMNFSPQFNETEEIMALLNKQTGKILNFRDNFIVVRERESLIFYRNYSVIDTSKIKININNSVFLKDLRQYLEIKKIDIAEMELDNSKITEYIDAENINDDFEIRLWDKGDKFIPLGMQSFKKISDFLTEQKIPAHKKKDQLLLTNRTNIVWVVGLRIDNRFRITSKTREVIKLCLN